MSMSTADLICKSPRTDDKAANENESDASEQQLSDNESFALWQERQDQSIKNRPRKRLALFLFLLFVE